MGADAGRRGITQADSGIVIWRLNGLIGGWHGFPQFVAGLGFPAGEFGAAEARGAFCAFDGLLEGGFGFFIAFGGS